MEMLGQAAIFLGAAVTIVPIFKRFGLGANHGFSIKVPTGVQDYRPALFGGVVWCMRRMKTSWTMSSACARSSHCRASSSRAAACSLNHRWISVASSRGGSGCRFL